MKENRKWIIAAIITCVVLVIAISAVAGASGANNPAMESVVPLQRVINRMGTALGDWSESLARWSTLEDENEALRLEVAELESQVKEARDLMVNRPYLQAAWEARQEDAYRVIEARVISKSKGNWFQTFVIDQGSDAGIAVNDTVATGIMHEDEFAEFGLIGQVAAVGDNFAVVQTLANKETNVAFEILRTGDQGIVEGDLAKVHQGFLFNEEANVAVGDDLVTTGISDYYLPGILIGQVTEVQKEGDQLVKRIQVETLVDFQKIKEVFILQEADHE
jgi:rod shape-determining protein MreC